MTLYFIDILKRMRFCGTPSTSVTRLVSNSSLYAHDRTEISNELENHLSDIKVYSLIYRSRPI